jgi:hypothetical protein
LIWFLMTLTKKLMIPQRKVMQFATWKRDIDFAINPIKAYWSLTSIPHLVKFVHSKMTTKVSPLPKL